MHAYFMFFLRNELGNEKFCRVAREILCFLDRKNCPIPALAEIIWSYYLV